MSLRVCWIPWLVVLLGYLLTGGRSAARGQASEEPMDASYTVGTTTNLFAAPGASGSVDGWLVRLPGDWTLERAVVLRYGSKRVPAEVRRAREATDAYTVVAPHAQRGPVELILRVEVGRAPGAAAWSVVPFTYDPMGYRALQEDHRVTRRIEVSPMSSRTRASVEQNRALDFAQTSAPLLLRRSALPPLAGDTGFTVEFWMKTTRLEEVVFSAWTGKEDMPYPIEMVVDVSGRLRYYCGQQGHHESITTRTPIADGRWHHVAVVYKAAQQRLVLLHEGTPIDSLRTEALPPFPDARLAVGGRMPDGSTAAPDTARRMAYSGQLDEMRFWDTARPAAVVRTMARRAYATVRDEGLVALDFDGELPDRLIASRPRGVEQVASDLVFTTPLRDLEAVVEDGTIRLAWEADDPGVEAFVVERSVGGESFQAAGRVRPRAATADADGAAPRYEFSDARGSGQIVYYRIRQQFADGTERTSGTLKLGLGAPDRPEATLIGNFPNPFNEATTIAYEVREVQPVTLTVWNVAGHQVAMLVDDTHTPGYYEHAFRADNLPSGTYFVRLKTPNASASHKMMLLK